MGGTGSLLPEGKLAQGHLHAHPPPPAVRGSGLRPQEVRSSLQRSSQHEPSGSASLGHRAHSYQET